MTNIKFPLPIKAYKQNIPYYDPNLKSLTTHIDCCPECRANMILNGWNANNFPFFSPYSEPKTKLKKNDYYTNNNKRNHTKKVNQNQLNSDNMLISIGKKFMTSNKYISYEHPRMINNKQNFM